MYTAPKIGSRNMNIINNCSLMSHFSIIKNPRVDRTKRHKLIDILTIAICAIISNADNFEEIELFGKHSGLIGLRLSLTFQTASLPTILLDVFSADWRQLSSKRHSLIGPMPCTLLLMGRLLPSTERPFGVPLMQQLAVPLYIWFLPGPRKPD